MAMHSTHKTSVSGKSATLAIRQARAAKYGTPALTRSGHVRAATAVTAPTLPVTAPSTYRAV